MKIVELDIDVEDVPNPHNLKPTKRIIFMKSGIELIAQERQEQIKKHGRTKEQDKELNGSQQLIKASRILTTEILTPQAISNGRPFGWDRLIWLKMCNKPYKERLIIAGALIAAEIDRLQNQS